MLDHQVSLAGGVYRKVSELSNAELALCLDVIQSGEMHSTDGESVDDLRERILIEQVARTLE